MAASFDAFAAFRMGCHKAMITGGAQTIGVTLPSYLGGNVVRLLG
jgi:hypothetical protein